MATPCNHEPMSEDSENDSGMETAENGEIEPLTEEQKAIEAEKRKEAGNEQYKMKNYGAALNFYTEAIEICPTCAAYYGNRAATYMMLSKYAEALEDARMSVQLDPTFTKGYLREAKCHSAMGNTAASIHMYEKVLQNEPNNKTAKNELTIAQALAHTESSAAKEIEKGDFRKAVWYLNKCIDQAPTCQKYKILKAEGLVLLKRYDEALEITVDILQLDSMNADALYVRGLCLYYQDNIEKAYQHFQKVLRLAPDHTKARNAFRKAKLLQAKKEEGNTAFRSGRLEEAYNLYTDALNIDPHNIFVNSKIYCNRATVLSKLKKTDEAISDCSQAIKLDDTYLKAYMRRARCYMDTEQYEEAVRDYEKIYQMDRTRDNKEMLQNAKLELKKSKRKDYYKILGVNKTAGEDEIKKAYKKRALLHHPDRHAHATDEVKKEEEKKFKEIGEAYAVLSDQKKKMRYDSGQDLDDMDGGFSDIDPNSIFQAFFGGPGGFSYGGGPGMGGNFGGASGGFPGGFTFQFG